MNGTNRLVMAVAGVATLVALPLAALAAPKVTINIKAEKEVVVTQGGKKITRKMAVKNTTPGDVLIYTLSYKNEGNELARDVVITDPVPEGTAFIPGSATEAGDLSFSIDKGKSYKKPALLSYEVKDSAGHPVKRTASPEEYTDIRWVIPSVAAGEKGTVSFKVKIR